MGRATAIGLAMAALLAPAAPARADPADLWATVNVCDTTARPDVLGVRASMPGLGRRAKMFMRFHAQYRQADGTWRELARAGDSGWVDVGLSRRAVRESGWSFTVAPPPVEADPLTLRGVVAFEWRRGGKVVRRESKRTRAGHPDTRGADPPEFSAARCRLS